MSRPTSPAADREHSPHLDTATSAHGTVVPGAIFLDPGTVAGTIMEENVAPEQEQHHGGADISAPRTEDAPEATNLGEEETPATAEQQQQQQQQEHQAETPPSPPPQTQAPQQQQQQPQQQASPEPSSRKSAGSSRKKQRTDTASPKSTPPRRTVHPISSPFPDPNLLEMKLTVMDILQRSSPRPATTSAPEQPTDGTIVLHGGAATRLVERTMIPVDDGFVAQRTESGRSLNSLEFYAHDWNAADSEEATSNPHLVQPHPAGLSALSQRVYEAEVAADVMKRALKSIEKTAKVRILVQ